jgi:hypothetical protein
MFMSGVAQTRRADQRTGAGADPTVTSGSRQQRCGAWRCAAFGICAVGAAVVALPIDVAAKRVDQDCDVVAWIDRHAVPLALPDLSSPNPGLDTLRSIVQPATVVGLGEPTHGSHEQFAMKLSIVQSSSSTPVFAPWPSRTTSPPGCQSTGT